MFIVINCLGMPFDGDTIKDESLGGSESAAYYMALELAKRGHNVTVFTTKAQPETDFDGVRYAYAGEQSEQAPCGINFHFYAENTPHDVLIIQRNPMAFVKRFASKINLWWLHDLATVAMRDMCTSHAWNIDGVLTVSEYHRDQVCSLYGFDKDFVHVIRNGVDLSLYEGDYASINTSRVPEEYSPLQIDDSKKNLIYSSRPERGLDHLVASQGIMERLGDKYHLYVCTYDNEPEQMQGYYNHLRGRCEELPNVTLLGALTKQELAALMRQCTALVYPTPSPFNPSFEEVSCITAMEAMAAHLPFVSTKNGALPETCKGSGSHLTDLNPDGFPDLAIFTQAIINVCTKWHGGLVEKQVLAAQEIGWGNSALHLMQKIGWVFSHANPTAVAISQWRNSDYYALAASPAIVGDAVDGTLMDDLTNCYGFARDDKFTEHYQEYYAYEKNRGVDYGPESLDGNSRFEYVAGCISNLSDGCVILDYGCAHGHYTINLAKRFPGKNFIGIDIEASNIDKANKWAGDEDITNVEFMQGQINGEAVVITGASSLALEADAIIAAEVLEHVADPLGYASVLSGYLKKDGFIIITVPFGPWEEQGFEEHYPWRAHLWHLERSDLHWLWGDMPNFKVVVAPSGQGPRGETLGSHIVTFGKGDMVVDKSYDEMFQRRVYNPTQTVSVCMIVKDAEEDLLRCLNSVKSFATEIIIAVDPGTKDDTYGVINRFKAGYHTPLPVVTTMEGLQPVEVGFDDARNHCIEAATCEWIFWVDHDEEVIHPENMHKYLRNNMMHGYAIAQHHMSAEPLGVLKTDLPCRLFRNRLGIKFVGRVHEHPAESGSHTVEQAHVLPDVSIIHDGYATNNVRMGRFHRNIDLMKRDRKDYPDRPLGKFLWIRDLSQMAVHDVQQNGGHVTPEIRKMAEEGIALWEDLLESEGARLVADSMEFYHVLAEILEGKDYSFSVDASLFGKAANGDARHFHGAFVKPEHVTAMFNKILAERTADFDNKYLR